MAICRKNPLAVSASRFSFACWEWPESDVCHGSTPFAQNPASPTHFPLGNSPVGSLFRRYQSILPTQPLGATDRSDTVN